jgi:hypothetical protein
MTQWRVKGQRDRVSGFGVLVLVRRANDSGEGWEGLQQDNTVIVV